MEIEFRLSGQSMTNDKFPQLTEIIAVLSEFDFAPPVVVEHNLSNEYQIFSIESASNVFGRSKKSSMSLYPENRTDYELSFTRDSDVNLLNLFIPADHLKSRSDETLRDLLVKLASFVPKLKRGKVGVSVDARGNYFDRLPYPTTAFGDPTWLHLVTPTSYDPFFTRDDLLNAPANEILEWDNGTVQIMTYSQFLPFDRLEVETALTNFSHYLNEKRKDGVRT
jgi:hypothetical protein